jgi:hypothetical protein
MGLHYGVPRARPDPAKRQVGGHTPHLQIGAVDASGQPWRVAVNVHPNDGNEVVFWIVDPLVGHPTLGSLAATPSGFSPTAANSSASLDYVSTSRPTASQNRTAVSSWRVARDTGGQENQMAAGLEGTRPVNRESQTVQVTKG